MKCVEKQIIVEHMDMGAIESAVIFCQKLVFPKCFCGWSESKWKTGGSDCDWTRRVTNMT